MRRKKNNFVGNTEIKFQNGSKITLKKYRIGGNEKWTSHPIERKKTNTDRINLLEEDVIHILDTLVQMRSEVQGMSREIGAMQVKKLWYGFDLTTWLAIGAGIGLVIFGVFVVVGYLMA